MPRFRGAVNMTAHRTDLASNFDQVAQFALTERETASPLKRRPPFSLRFSDAERSRLEEEAGGIPLAAHIKERLFAADATPVRRRHVPASIEDRQAVAKLLSMLGASRYANNLNQMAHLANLGLLAMTDEERSELALSIAYIGEMRRLLVQALGLKPESSE